MKVMMTTIVAVLLVGCATMLPPDLAIYDAVQKGDVEAAKQTIADGADVNAKDKDDFTSFHCAAAFGHKETAELILRSITIASRDWDRYCAALPDSR